MIKRRLVLLLLIFSTWLSASQDAFTVRQVALHESPRNSSPALLSLNKNSQVSILKRQGGWYQVQAQGQKGWLKMIAVRFAPAAKSTQLVGSVQYQSNTTLTTGVRGLDEVGLVAGGRGISLEQIEQYQVSPEKARSFALKAGLSSREVDYVE